jgi:hypothetical protein
MKVKLFNPYADKGYLEVKVNDFNKLYQYTHVRANIERVKNLTQNGCFLNVQPLFKQAFAADRYNKTRLATGIKYPANVYVYNGDEKYIKDVSSIFAGIYMFPNEIIDLLTYTCMSVHDGVISGLKELPEFEKVYVTTPGCVERYNLFSPTRIDNGNDCTKFPTPKLAPSIHDAFNAAYTAYCCGCTIPESLKHFRIENLTEARGIDFIGRLDWCYGIEGQPSEKSKCLTNYMVIDNDDIPIVPVSEFISLLSTSNEYVIQRGRLDSEGMQGLIQNLKDVSNDEAKKVMFNCILELDWDDKETAMRACYAMHSAEYGRWFSAQLQDKQHIPFCKELRKERGIPDLCSGYSGRYDIIRRLYRTFGFLPDDIFDDLKEYFRGEINGVVYNMMQWKFDASRELDMTEVMCNEIKVFYNEEKERKDEEPQC